MSFSYYEVYITSLRAFTGMGFPYGADEDAAYMVSWLELNKLNGVKLLAETFQNFDNQYEGRINFNDINATAFDLKNILGIIIAFLGIIILSGSPNLEGKYLGVVLVLGGAFTWSLGQVLVKPISEKINGIALTAWMGVFGGPQLILASQIIEGNVMGNIISADYRAWLIVLYLGLLMNCLGYSLWYYVLGRYPVNKIITTMLLLPVTGVLTAIIFLGERPDTKVFVGGLIIIFGVSMILIGKTNNKT